MNKLEEKQEKEIIKKLNKNLSSIYSKCEITSKKLKEGGIVNEKDYILFTFSADIYYRIKDITFLNRMVRAPQGPYCCGLSK